MFDQAKNMFQMQKKAKQVKKDLKNTHIEAEENGVIITINGEQEVISIHIPQEMLADSEKLKETLKKCLNKGIKKSQEIAAEMMREIMGGMNIPGLS